jgi:subtilase-type serine protease
MIKTLKVKGFLRKTEPYDRTRGGQMKKTLPQTVKTLTCFGVLTVVASQTAQALQYWDYTLADGSPFVTLEVYDEGDDFVFNNYPDDDGSPLQGESGWTLSDDDKTRIDESFDYLGRMIGKFVVSTGSIAVVTDSDKDGNAAATSNIITTGPLAGITELTAELLYGVKGDDNTGLIFINHTSAEDGNWYYGPMYSLPENGEVGDLSATLAHEMFHALGLLSSAVENKFGDILSVWDKGLRDIDGDAPKAAMSITDDHSDRSNTFDLYSKEERDKLGLGESDAGVYYTSENVQDVLQGATIYYHDQLHFEKPVGVNGLPVNGWEEGVAELSHIELQNSLMSHQYWRNWNTFMEAELAVLQDLGFDIDRRDWFGYSVYNSGITLVNMNPYYARNGDGTGWIEGVANDNPWGVGLHIYGRKNYITQAADILTSGTYALGIRVDGSNNTLRIAPDVQVRSDGDYGYALAVTYGKNHHIVHQGTLAADGAYGVGAMFSFGDNTIGETTEQRGSYIYDPATDEDLGADTIGLDGALVSSFDVAGSLSGTRAAIYIDDSALVSNINIMNGASLSGNIVSLWNPMADRVQFYQDGLRLTDPEQVTVDTVNKMVTHLTFGLKADEMGAAIEETSDENFCLFYTGNIYGGWDDYENTPVTAAMTMDVKGGELVFNGSANVLSVTVDEGATLSGEGRYNLAALYTLLDGQEVSDDVFFSYGTFINNGTLSPGNGIGTMEINGAFEMGEKGNVVIEFGADGTTDHLVIRDETLQTASDFGEQVDLMPSTGFYQGTQTIDLSEAIVVKSDSDSNSVLLDSADFIESSPTLTMTGSTDNNVLTLTTSRDADAYSQYAANSNTRSLAAAFDKHADEAQGGMQDLVAALDFSNPDGSTLNTAYEKLGPDVFARAGRAALMAQRVVSGAVLEQISSPTALEVDATGRSFYIRPLGGYGKIEERGIRSNYAGLIAGVDVKTSLSEGGLTLGTHAAVLDRKDKYDGTDGSQTDAQSFYLGAHARYDFATTVETYAFGLVQLTVENADTDRVVRFDGYADSASSDWTGWGGSLALGIGQAYPLTTNVKLGPVAWLDYSFMHQPSVTEESAHGSALHVEGETYQSLRSSLGVKFSAQFGADETKAALDAMLVWNHEFLKRYGTAESSLAPWRDVSFSFDEDVDTRDTGTAAVSLTGRFTDGFAASLGAGADFGGDVSGIWGHLNLKWEF